MPNNAKEMKNQKLVILGLTLLGLVLRIIFLLAMKSNWPGWDTPTIDALYHHLWALQIAGDGIPEGTGPFFRAPLYPYMLGLIYSLLGTNFTIVFLLQHIIGVMAVPLVFIVARNYFPPAVAVIAALLTAINGILIYFESQLLLDFLTVLFYLLFIYILTIAQKQGKDRYFLLAGAIAGLFAITRPNILAVIPLVVIWIFFLNHGLKKKIKNCLLLVIGTLIIVFPITLRNIIEGDDTVLIASQGGINFYIGNNEYADGYTALLPGFGHNWQYSDAEYEAAYNLGKKPGELKPSEVSSFYYSKAFEFILSSPGRYCKLLVKKLYLFWNRFEISNNNNIYFLTDYIGMSFYPLFLFAIISPLGFVGTILCFFKGRRFTIFPILILGYMITVILFFITARFRLPMMPLLTIMAGFTIYEIYRAISGKLFKHALVLIVSVIVVGIISWSDFYNHHSHSMAMANYSLGNMFLKKRDYESAKSQYQKAVQMADCVPNAHLNLGVIAFYEKDTLKARSEFEEELKTCGSSAKAYNNLSMLARLKQKYEQAYALADSAVIHFPNFKEAYINRIYSAFAVRDSSIIKYAVRDFVDAFPSNIAARYFYGEYLLTSDSSELARQQFLYVSESSDKDIVAEYDLSEIYSSSLPHGYNQKKIRGKSHYQLGLLNVKTGDMESALINFKQAVTMMPDDSDAHHNLALAYDRIGDYKTAETEFKNAIALDSANAIYYFNYAMTLGKIGDYQKAADMLEKALVFKPDFEQAKTILQTLKTRLDR